MKLSRNVLLFILFFPSITTPPAICKIWEEKGEKYYFEGGLKYYREKNYELALKDFLPALKLSAKNKLTLKYVNAKRNELKIREERGLLNQAIRDYQEQNYEVALEKFVQVLDLNPRNSKAREYI